MAKGDLIPVTLGILGLGFLGAFYISTTASTAMAEDNPDTANLVIEVGGSTSGEIVIDLMPGVAPAHVERVTTLARNGAYDGVVFHRVIDGFMAQTGDVQFGRHGEDTARAGTGASQMPDLPAEFNETSFTRGIVGMARSGNPNSGNSQFFIMFAPATHLDRQYTAFGRVISGMDVVDSVRKGDAARNGVVRDPDFMSRVTVAE